MVGREVVFEMKDYRTNPDRIPPDHALAKAARDTNNYSEAHGLKGTVDWLGMDLTVDQLRYLAEQRALRAFAARYLGYNMGHNPVVDEQVAQMLVKTEQWLKHAAFIIAAYMDGFAIGWRGGQIELEKSL
jgi:hypothetical protein